MDYLCIVYLAWSKDLLAGITGIIYVSVYLTCSKYLLAAFTWIIYVPGICLFNLLFWWVSHGLFMIIYVSVYLTCSKYSLAHGSLRGSFKYLLAVFMDYLFVCITRELSTFLMCFTWIIYVSVFNVQ